MRRPASGCGKPTRCFEVLESRALLAANVILTEFLSDNSATLADGEGQFSDWIELYNAGDAPANLNGYRLTDDADNLGKWAFPERVLDPRSFLVVFASGRGEPDAAGNLHTNFRLSSEGEYLALVKPDGTVASAYSPTFPAQRSDISYGIDQNASARKLVDAKTPARYLVPDFFSGPGLGTDWIGRVASEPFDDSAWLAGTASLGYDTDGDTDPPNIASTGTASQSSTDFGMPASNAIDGNLDSFTHTADERNSWWRLTFPRERHLGRLVLWNRVDCCAERLSNFRVSVFNANNEEVFGQDFYSPEQGGGFPLAGEPVEIDLPPGATGNLVQVRFLDQNNAGNGWLSLSEVQVYEASGFRNLFETDLQATMRHENSSVYLRIPFDAPDLGSINSLRLAMQYDDGFIAYLNGNEIARRHSPPDASWASAATTDRSDADAVTVELIDVSQFKHLLRPAGNLLALHGLNDEPESPDFLIRPELLAIAATEGGQAYFPDPTPGAFNVHGVQGFVEDVSFSVARGIYDRPIETLVTTSTLGASIIYTTDGSPPSLLNGTRVDASNPNASPTAVIGINTTATIRAAAFRDGLEPSRAVTHTYLFLSDVIRQPASPPGLPDVWDGQSEAPIPADYEMDPQVVNDPAYSDEIIQGLKSIPTMSIVMDPDDLFGTRNGIYVNSGDRGDKWEKPTSLEIIETDGDSFQANTGILIHGYSWRFHSNTPKHSFRLEFNKKYGPSKLEYPLFPDAPVTRFDSIVLRAQGGRAWAGLQEPHQAQYIRDVFARDTARDMGKIDGHAAYFHLYLNGLYWGLYHAVERPDAQMGEEYFGGSDEDYDALNRRTTTNEAIDGDLDRYNEMIALANRGVTSPEAYAQMQRYVDLDNLIDFFLIHQYTTNRDGPEIFDSNNQRAIGSRVGDPKFRFFVWDMEYSMWNATDNVNIDVDVPTSASRVYSALRENPEFRLYYADRVHQHMFNGGALTAEKAAARWKARADEIYTAIIGESARWGDAKRAQPYTRDREWMRELNRLMDDYFPQRTDILLGQLREAGLYPAIDAASFNQHGGSVPAGFQLQMDAPQGTIYYTLDGTDPRLPSESVPGGGQLIPRGAAWKYLDDGSNQGTAWRELDFDDSGWASGQAELGYGDSDEKTTVHCGPSAPACDTNNHVTTYFRHEFQVDDASKIGELKVSLKRDDGAVVYLNGREIGRSNMPEGPVDFQTLASRSGQERAYVDLKVSSAGLVNGRNVLSVEIHQRSRADNDVSFDLELNAIGAIGGTPSTSARVYTGPIVLNADVVARARVFHNGAWSALNQAQFHVGAPAAASNLRISEVHYHPANEPDAEFVELVNISDQTVNLLEVRFDGSFEFEFTGSMITSLQPAERLVVVRDLSAFSASYDTSGIRVSGEFLDGQLSDGGERIVLHAANGDLIQDLTYDDEAPWPDSPDGHGPSLELIDVDGDANDSRNWRPSAVDGGTPGRESSLPGDSNRDGKFNSQDLVLVFQAGEYEDETVGNSTWEEGDWNADRDFNTTDLVLAFQYGRYSAEAILPAAPSPPARVDSWDDLRPKRKRPPLVPQEIRLPIPLRSPWQRENKAVDALFGEEPE
jgi:hypothetical protein